MTAFNKALTPLFLNALPHKQGKNSPVKTPFLIAFF